jgi:hypothetical protein
MSNADKRPTCLRGKEGEAFAKERLVQVKIDAVNWKVLWKNPQTGEFWKEYFPQSELQGGGPPEFVQITEEEAKSEFTSW